MFFHYWECINWAKKSSINETEWCEFLSRLVRLTIWQQQASLLLWQQLHQCSGISCRVFQQAEKPWCALIVVITPSWLKLHHGSGLLWDVLAVLLVFFLWCICNSHSPPQHIFFRSNSFCLHMHSPTLFLLSSSVPSLSFSSSSSALSLFYSLSPSFHNVIPCFFMLIPPPLLSISILPIPPPHSPHIFLPPLPHHSSFAVENGIRSTLTFPSLPLTLNPETTLLFLSSLFFFFFLC